MRERKAPTSGRVPDKSLDGSLSAPRNREPLSQRFPLLSQQPGLSADVVADLTLDDTSLGRKYKRGKAARLESLENMENRLQVTPLRAEVASLRAVTDRIERLIAVDRAAIAKSLAPPTSLEQARVVLELSFLQSTGFGLEFQLDAASMLMRLDQIVSDGVSRDILRDLIISTESSLTPQDIAERHGLGRQTIYDRQARLVARLDELIMDVEFSRLVTYLRTHACVVHGSRLTASTAHPLVAIALLAPGVFPSVTDLVAVGLWGVARRAGGSKRSFRLVGRDAERTAELVLEVD